MSGAPSPLALRVLGRIVPPPRPAAPTARTRVYVALRGAAEREGVRQFLASAPDLVVDSADRTEGELRGEAVLAAVRQAPHGVVLLGADLRAPDAFEALARLRAEAPAARVVLVASVDDADLPLRALAFGAVGHVDGRDRPAAFRDAARAAVRGERVLSAVLREALVERALTGAVAEPAASYNAAPPRLTDREFQVLRLVARGLGTRDVAREIAVSESTVRSHKAQLRAKLGLDGDAALARYAIDRGWG